MEIQWRILFGNVQQNTDKKQFVGAASTKGQAETSKVNKDQLPPPAFKLRHPVGPMVSLATALLELCSSPAVGGGGILGGKSHSSVQPPETEHSGCLAAVHNPSILQEHAHAHTPHESLTPWATGWWQSQY